MTVAKIKTRRFNVPPTDSQDSRKFLDDLNKFVSYGSVITRTLNNSIFEWDGYSADPNVGVSVSMPDFIVPRSGDWALIDVHMVSSTSIPILLDGPYFKVQTMMRISSGARILASFNQRDHKLAAGIPFALRTSAAELPFDGVLETRVTVYGYPTTSLNGIMVQYRVLNTGD